jgi:hypothetical protein
MIGVLEPSITPRSAPMTSLAQVAETMQHVLTTVAEEAARTTGCVRRPRVFDGARWVQTLVFGCLGTPRPSLSSLTQTAAALGVAVTPQALDQRFTAEAAACLEQVLAAAVAATVAADPVAVPLLRRFAGVYVLDSTSLALPVALAALWPGCGNGAQPTAATLKLGVRLELTTGRLEGPTLAAGRTHDRALALASAPLPPEALRLADLGFWKLDELRDLSAAGSFWLSRLQSQVAVFDADGRRWEMADLLAHQAADAVDVPVTLGVAQRLPARLLAQRVPPTVAEERRRRLHAEGKRRGQGAPREDRGRRQTGGADPERDQTGLGRLDALGHQRPPGRPGDPGGAGAGPRPLADRAALQAVEEPRPPRRQPQRPAVAGPVRTLCHADRAGHPALDVPARLLG